MAEAGSIATTVVTDVAAQVVAIAALCGALGLLSRLKPVRWIWGRLVSGPLGEWLGRAIGRGVATFHAEKIEPALTEMREDMTVMRNDITDIRKELTTNDGSTLRDAVHRTEAKADRAVAYTQRLAEQHGWPPGMDPVERTPERQAS